MLSDRNSNSTVKKNFFCFCFCSEFVSAAPKKFNLFFLSTRTWPRYVSQKTPHASGAYKAFFFGIALVLRCVAECLLEVHPRPGETVKFQKKKKLKNDNYPPFSSLLLPLPTPKTTLDCCPLNVGFFFPSVYPNEWHNKENRGGRWFTHLILWEKFFPLSLSLQWDYMTNCIYRTEKRSHWFYFLDCNVILGI